MSDDPLSQVRAMIEEALADEENPVVGLVGVFLRQDGNLNFLFGWRMGQEFVLTGGLEQVKLSLLQAANAVRAKMERDEQRGFPCPQEQAGGMCTWSACACAENTSRN